MDRDEITKAIAKAKYVSKLSAYLEVDPAACEIVFEKLWRNRKLELEIRKKVENEIRRKQKK